MQISEPLGGAARVNLPSFLPTTSSCLLLILLDHGITSPAVKHIIDICGVAFGGAGGGCRGEGATWPATPLS